MVSTFGNFLKLGCHFGGSQNRGYSRLGSILGSPYFAKLPFISFYVAIRRASCNPDIIRGQRSYHPKKGSSDSTLLKIQSDKVFIGPIFGFKCLCGAR